MKKLITILMCICFSISLFGCEEVTKKPEGELAYIGYYNASSNDGYHEAISRALQDYATAEEIQYAEYQLRDTTTKTFTSTVELAIKTGATTFIIPYDFYQPLLEVHSQFPEVSFVLLDTPVDEEVLGDTLNVYLESLKYF